MARQAAHPSVKPNLKKSSLRSISLRLAGASVSSGYQSPDQIHGPPIVLGHQLLRDGHLVCVATTDPQQLEDSRDPIVCEHPSVELYQLQ